jgi:glycosyltransferase involved in cell wall biosynthesis
VSFTAHSALAPLLQLSERLGIKFAFITDPSPPNPKWYQWIPISPIRQFCYQQLLHLKLAFSILFHPKADVFLIFTNNPLYSLPIYVALFLRHRPAFFLVHGSQQLAHRSLFHRIAHGICAICVRYGELYPVHLELGDAVLPASRRFPETKTLCIPHPHPFAENAPAERKHTGRFKVGVVGMLRREKPIHQLVKILIEAQEKMDFQVVLGTPFWQKEAWVDDLPVELVDTTTIEQYFECLSDLDVLVVDFARSEYYFRPSGVVVDAAMCGCFVLCPNYPVFQHEVTVPVTIGQTFSDLQEIPGLLQELIGTLRQRQVDFAAWRQHREMAKIAPLFGQFLVARGMKLDAEQKQG